MKHWVLVDRLAVLHLIWHMLLVVLLIYGGRAAVGNGKLYSVV
jgi:hypothetical protein